ncbi:translation initiation factor IF-2-like [Vulpes lagopus]|uniref:translation initiation factor IF-2-like n=1 Tax=Vulpes lagopus TaxID=494514 RepID=UPI001BC962DB|nr:translation initiation factor IF-2-like [Vulpes lagopus]
MFAHLSPSAARSVRVRATAARAQSRAATCLGRPPQSPPSPGPRCVTSPEARRRRARGRSPAAALAAGSPAPGVGPLGGRASGTRPGRILSSPCKRRPQTAGSSGWPSEHRPARGRWQRGGKGRGPTRPVTHPGRARRGWGVPGSQSKGRRRVQRGGGRLRGQPHGGGREAHARREPAPRPAPRRLLPPPGLGSRARGSGPPGGPCAERPLPPPASRLPRSALLRNCPRRPRRAGGAGEPRAGPSGWRGAGPGAERRRLQPRGCAQPAPRSRRPAPPVRPPGQMVATPRPNVFTSGTHRLGPERTRTL